VTREHPEDWRNNAADRACAAAVNAAFAVVNATAPGTSTPAETVVRCISIDPPCSCSCAQHCAVCVATTPPDAA
jgi:hypothetical protein